MVYDNTGHAVQTRPDRHRAPVYEIRVLETTEELAQYYRLRMDVYSDLGWKQSDESGFEMDEFDRYSIPMGTFDLGSGALVGTARLVTPDVQNAQEVVMRRLLAEVDQQELLRRVDDEPQWPLPAIVSPETLRQIQVANTARYPVYELGRIIVHPDHRVSGVSRGMIEFGFALATARGGSVAVIGASPPQHVDMYRKYGFELLPDAGFESLASFGGLAATVMIVRTDMLPHSLRTIVAGLVRALRSGPERHVCGAESDSRRPAKHMGPA